MVKKIIQNCRRFFARRSMILLAVFFVLAAILIGRLYNLQIINGQSYADNFTVKTTKTRTLKSSRGNIYDVNGKLLAYNQLSNAVTIEDNEDYATTREKNLSLNGEIYRLTELILEKGDALYHDFHIILDPDGNFAFDTENETTLARFRADVFGYRTTDELSEKEANASASEIIEILAGEDRFGLENESNPYSSAELEAHGLPETLTNEQMLNIIVVRYQLNLISYQRYMSVTVAKAVSESTVAAVKENTDLFPGVDIAEDYIRVYNNAESMSSIIGYTGSPSAEELEELQSEDDKYSSTSVIGKTGIEQYMETYLQGTDGSEQVVVDNLGRVLETDTDSRVDPVQGNDVYLTIDSDLQEACYRILEQRIAGILVSNIQNIKSVDYDLLSNNDAKPIPIYDVYNALISNNVIDIAHFSEEDASETEKEVYEHLKDREKEVIDWITSELNSDSPLPYNELTDAQKEYTNYVYNRFLTENEGVIDSSLVDTSSDVYQAFAVDGTASLKEYLMYAANQNWIDLTKLPEQNAYVTAEEIYQEVIAYIQENLPSDTAFDKILYKYLLLDDVFTADQLVQILYDQGVLDSNDQNYAQFTAGTLSPAELIVAKISNLEITPAQLALDPCSGSIVLTDPDSGEVRACVSYPGYDNNRLANTMDTSYFYQLNIDQSSPFYNKATQQLTAPGSTFKPVMAGAGLTEGVINADTLISCSGRFGEGLVDEGDQLNCWYHSGHGLLNVEGAIENSCNVFFCTVGYDLGLDSEGKYDQSQALSKIREYADKFGLNLESGIEIQESSPHVTDSLPIPSSIGQGTHQYTTSQLARYASVLQNKGTVYALSLLGKVTDPNGNTIKEYSPEVLQTCEMSDETWNHIQNGMRRVVQSNTVFSDLNIQLYGKTGTAQESMLRPDHALMIGFAHMDNSSYEDVAYAVRIAYGYSSKNAALVVHDVMQYYYALEDETSLITGQADSSGMSNQVITD